MRQRAGGSTPGQAYYMPSPADALVIAFRKWVDKFGSGGPFGAVDSEYLKKLEPRQTQAQLLDRCGCVACWLHSFA